MRRIKPIDEGPNVKVCILTATSAWGGAEVHTVGLAQILRSRGHEVFVVQLLQNIYGQKGWEEEKTGKLLHIEISKSISQLSFLESYRLLGPLRANVCILVNAPTIVSWAFELAARCRFSRYITIEHMVLEPIPPRTSRHHFGGLVLGLGLWRIRVFLSRFMRGLPPHRVLCVSDAVRKRLVEDYRFPAAKVTTVYSGIDPVKFQRNEQIRRRLRTEWGIPENAFVFGAVGRLSSDKGYDLALESFMQLVASSPHSDIRLVLVGEGPLRPSLQAAVKEAALDNYVLFPGFSDRPWEVYSAFDVFIMPSRTEGLGLALLEAMACCCFTIAMGVGGVKDILTDSSFACVVPPGDRAGFLGAMKQAAQTCIDKLGEMGRRAREHVISNFNSTIQYPALADAIERECGVIAPGVDPAD